MEKTLKLIVDKLDSLDQKVTTMDQRLSDLDQKVTTMDQRLSNMDQKVTTMDQRLSNMDQKVTKMDHRFSALDQKVTTMDQRLSALDQKVNTMDQRLTTEQKRQGDLLHQLINTVAATNVKISETNERMEVLETKVDTVIDDVKEIKNSMATKYDLQYYDVKISEHSRKFTS
ncbi:hypothetical protein V7121_21115 [Neobacillus drentensis]